MKLVLGTANLNQKYGVLNQTTTAKESLKILNYSSFKINEIDTASKYDGFNEIIKKIKKKNFKINTKFSDIKKRTYKDIYRELSSQIEIFLDLYNIKKINILFLHRPNIILSKKGNSILKVLSKFKKDKKIAYIGFSVYSPNEAKLLIKKFKPDYIQAPLNILDQRMINSGMLKQLKKKNIKFQARSIYLQGILTDKKILNNKKFLSDKLIIVKWYNWISKKKYQPEKILIEFIKKNKDYIDSVVISAKNLNQIKNNYNYFKNNNKITFLKIPKLSEKVIDPRQWKYK